MPNSGLLISCATVAASLPIDAIFSELSSVLWIFSSSAVLRRTRSSISACTPSTFAVILLKERARSPSSSSERTGSRYARSPSATRCVPSISSFTGRYTTIQMNPTASAEPSTIAPTRK